MLRYLEKAVDVKLRIDAFVLDSTIFDATTESGLPVTSTETNTFMLFAGSYPAW